MENNNFNINDYDCYFYIGAISMEGYRRLCNQITNNKQKDKVILCLVTYGGNPDAGFRIGRALQHHYKGNVTIYIPNICKSAGTLTVIAAKKIIMHNQGELGPLDIQLRKDDELGVSNSGLDIFKTLETLEDRANLAFSKYLRSIRFGQGLSTKMSAEMATKLVDAIIKPIAEQIDPMKIGEHQRANDIAYEYGKRLAETSMSLKDNTSLEKLIRGYPTHGFVIDRKEARTIFSCVEEANNSIISRYQNIHDILELRQDILSQLYVEYLKQEEEQNGSISDTSSEDNISGTTTTNTERSTKTKSKKSTSNTTGSTESHES